MMTTNICPVCGREIYGGQMVSREEAIYHLACKETKVQKLFRLYVRKPYFVAKNFFNLTLPIWLYELRRK